MFCCSKQSSLFSFYALPSGGKSKDAVVHWKHFSLDELVEEHGALPDDPRGLGLLILTPAEGQAVVHAAFLMEDNLLLFNKTNSLLLHLVSLKRDIWVQCGQMARLYVQYLAI